MSKTTETASNEHKAIAMSLKITEIKEPKYGLEVFHHCKHCDGAGAYKDAAKEIVRCLYCSGGYILEKIYGKEEIIKYLCTVGTGEWQVEEDEEIKGARNRLSK